MRYDEGQPAGGNKGRLAMRLPPGLRAPAMRLPLSRLVDDGRCEKGVVFPK